MRLTKRLIVNGKQVPLLYDRVRLRLNHVGEGIFETSEPPLGGNRGLVELYASVAEQHEYLMLTGAMLEAKQQAPGRFRLTARELSVVLETPALITKRNCTAREVVAHIEKRTGLRFLLPAGSAFLDEHRIQFNFNGTCREALDAVAKAWNVTGAVWNQLPDGRIYWGHWASGPFNAADLPIEENLIYDLDREKRTMVMPYIPALRPGMVVRSSLRFRIDALTFSEDTVKVNWTPV